jgi:hypothetical protein
MITNSSGTKRYFQGYPDDGSRTVNTIITIPAYESKLKVIYNGTNGATLDLGSSNSLSYNINTSNKSAKKTAIAQINLGSIADFTLYSVTGAISNAGISNITGNIGTNTGAISGFGSPSILNGIIHNGNSVTTQAAVDLKNLITQINNIATTNSTHAAAFGSETLTFGVYAIGGASSIAGTLT